MADKIVVLNAGRIEQVGTPLELYNQPRNRFVAGFIGNPKMNFLEGVVRRADGAGIEVDLGPLGRIEVPRAAPAALVGQQVAVGIRPEHVALGEAAFVLDLVPGLIERLGIHTIAYAPLPGGESFTALFDGEPAVAAGQGLRIGIDPGAVHLFDTAGAAIGAAA